ncbi:GNAT family N-acetyltransferase [Tessaracoccus terricola]
MIHAVTGDQLTTTQLYEIWKIRDVVFAVEQQCDEPDVDDLDLLPTTTHMWIQEGSVIVSYLRVLAHGEVRRIGRVCTLASHRGKGLSGRILDEAHRRWGSEPIRIGAQAYLEAWYAKYGYVTTGDPFTEAGIDHVPMIRA